MDQPPEDDASWKYPPPPETAKGAPGQPAAWWKRAVAYIIDSLIVGAPLGILGAVTGLTEFIDTGNTVRVEVDPLFQVLSLLVSVAYSAVMDGSARQASVGKMALRILVGDAETGAPIGPGRAGSRRLISSGLFLLWFFPGAINALSPLWDARRQGWHDKAVRSVVLNAGP